MRKWEREKEEEEESEELVPSLKHLLCQHGTQVLLPKPQEPHRKLNVMDFPLVSPVLENQDTWTRKSTFQPTCPASLVSYRLVRGSASKSRWTEAREVPQELTDIALTEDAAPMLNVSQPPRTPVPWDPSPSSDHELLQSNVNTHIWTHMHVHNFYFLS